MTNTTFEIGKTYGHRWAGDFTVTARTAKFITIERAGDEPKRVGVKTHDGVEYAYPDGVYSQCPVINADRRVKAA